MDQTRDVMLQARIVIFEFGQDLPILFCYYSLFIYLSDLLSFYYWLFVVFFKFIYLFVDMFVS